MKDITLYHEAGCTTTDQPADTKTTTTTAKRQKKQKASKAERHRRQQQKALEEERQYLLMETITLLSADLYQEIYDKCETWTDTCEEIIDLAKKFERKLKWNANGDEERDYIEELEKFEQKVRNNLNR